MFSDRRLLRGGIISALGICWILVALGMPNGFIRLLVFIVPAGFLAVVSTWLFFTFAGDLFTWSRAVRSIVAGVLVLAPLLSYFVGTSRSQDLTTKFLVLVVVAWAASMGGTLWNLAGAVADAFREWRANHRAWRSTRRTGRSRRVYVPV